MKEYGWFHWNDFGRMAGLVVPAGDQRKVRLAACAILRQVADRITDPRTATALDATEGYADFRIRWQDLRLVAAAAGDVVQEFEVGLFADKAIVTEEWRPHWHPDVDESASLEWQLRHQGGNRPAAQVARLVAQLAASRSVDDRAINGLSVAVSLLLDPQAASRDRETAHCDVLRDIFGNPFRPVTFDPSWRTEAVMALARGMYESRDFAPLPVLADALEDAGCADADILAHCRGPGPHVRGCWVVDLVLGNG